MNFQPRPDLSGQRTRAGGIAYENEVFNVAAVSSLHACTIAK